MRIGWVDDGVQPHVYLSTAGDFVSLGTTTDYPFTSGGPNGVPTGWTNIETGGGVPADVARSVGQGRFNIAITGGGIPGGGKYYGAYRDFTIQADHTYIMKVQARQIDGRDNCYRYFLFDWYKGGTNSGHGESSWRVTTDWEDIVLYLQAPTGATTLRVYLEADWYEPDGVAVNPNWGMQYQNFSLTDMATTQPEPTWKEVTCDVRALSTRYGRDKAQNRFDIGSMQLSILNDGGEWTYQPVHPFNLRPGRFIRVTLVRPGSVYEYPMFYGIIDALKDTYTLDGHSYKNVSCVDISSLLSNTTVPTTWSENMDINSGVRIYTLLISAGWLLTKLIKDTGVYSQQSPRANGRTIRDEISLGAESEGGYLWTDPYGQIIFHNRNWKPSRVTTVQAELLATPYCESPLPPVDDIPTASGAPIVELQDLGSTWDRARIINLLQLANQGGIASTFNDYASQKKYGPISYQRFDLLNSNSHPEYLTERANDIMAGFTESILRVNQVSFRPTIDSYAWVQDLWMMDLVRVRYELHSPDGLVWGWSIVTHVQGIEHSLTTNDWQVRLNLDVVESFNYWNSGWFTDDQWDIGLWDTALWDGGQIAKWDGGSKWDEPSTVWGA